jgi:hypothetical protein
MTARWCKCEVCDAQPQVRLQKANIIFAFIEHNIPGEAQIYENVFAPLKSHGSLNAQLHFESMS